MNSEKKILRPLDGTMLGGVCAAIARHFGIDVTLIRLGWVLLVLLFGTGVLAYIICWVVIPEDDAVS